MASPTCYQDARAPWGGVYTGPWGGSGGRGWVWGEGKVLGEGRESGRREEGGVREGGLPQHCAGPFGSGVPEEIA